MNKRKRKIPDAQNKLLSYGQWYENYIESLQEDYFKNIRDMEEISIKLNKIYQSASGKDKLIYRQSIIKLEKILTDYKKKEIEMINELKNDLESLK